MSGTTINELNNFFFGVGKENVPQTNPSDTGFAETFKEASDSRAEKFSDDAVPKKSSGLVKVEKSINNVKTVENSDETLSEEDSIKVDEETVEVLATSMDNLMLRAADILGVNPEELEAALEELDLDASALMDPDSVNKLVMEINSLESPIELVSDSKLWSQVTEINEFAAQSLDEMADELAIPKEKLLDLYKETASADGIEEAMPNVTAEDILNESENIDNIKNIPKEKEQLNIDNNNHNHNDYDIDNNDELLIKNEIENSGAKEAQSDSGHSDNDSNSDNDSLLSNMNNNAIKNNQYGTENEIKAEFKDSYAGTDPQRIFEQVGDYIKTKNFDDIKQVEMQLSPASLGSVQIRVSQTENGIEAHIIASTEAAKVALETSMVELKEAFNEQGVKVNEVSVSVSSQSFNENLEQEADSERDREAILEGQRNQTRRMNLNVFDEDYAEGDLPADVVLAKEIMEANGGSVDLKA